MPVTSLLPVAHPLRQRYGVLDLAFITAIAELEDLEDNVDAGMYFVESPNRSQKTVVFVIRIGSHDLKQGRWKEMQPIVRSFLREHFEHDNIPFRFYVTGPMGPLGKSVDDDRDQWSHTAETEMGASIGPEDSMSAGTVGTYVRIYDKQSGKYEEDQYAITCCHVVFPDGESEHRNVGHSIAMASPAVSDHETTCQTLREQVSRYEELVGEARRNRLDMTIEEMKSSGMQLREIKREQDKIVHHMRLVKALDETKVRLKDTGLRMLARHRRCCVWI